MTSPITSPAANAELVRAGFQAFNAGDADRCMARLAPDLIINLAELPQPQHGRETWRQGFEMIRRAFPDLQAHIEDIVAAQDKVAVRLRFRGTHSGEFLGRPRDRPHHRVRQPRVLPHRRRPHRRRMDLLRHRHPAPSAQLTALRRLTSLLHHSYDPMNDTWSRPAASWETLKETGVLTELTGIVGPPPEPVARVHPECSWRIRRRRGRRLLPDSLLLQERVR